MNKFRFTPEMFRFSEKIISHQASRDANDALDEHLKTLKMVYSHHSYWHEQAAHADTHTAFLFDVKEIKPKCEHEYIKYSQYKLDEGCCTDCGARLIRKWREVE